MTCRNVRQTRAAGALLKTRKNYIIKKANTRKCNTKKRQKKSLFSSAAKPWNKHQDATNVSLPDYYMTKREKIQLNNVVIKSSNLVQMEPKRASSKELTNVKRITKTRI